MTTFSSRACAHFPSRLPAKAAAAPLSAFDPDLPEDGALIIAEVLRDQLNALNDDIQTRATQADVDADVAALNAGIQTRATGAQLNNAINMAIASTLPQTSNNSNGAALFDQAVPPYYDTYFHQGIMDKLNELINAVRR